MTYTPRAFAPQGGDRSRFSRYAARVYQYCQCCTGRAHRRDSSHPDHRFGQRLDRSRNRAAGGRGGRGRTTTGNAIVSGDRVLLIVENEPGFASLLLDAAREKGFKGIVTSSGVSALALAGEYMPAAVTLDIFLPDIDGWRVLDRLKNDDQTRHVPVSVISTDESRERALKSGAFQFVAKPMQSKEVIDALLDRLGAYLRRARRHWSSVSEDAANARLVRSVPRARATSR